MKNQVFDHNTVVDMQYGKRYYYTRDIDSIVIAFKGYLKIGRKRHLTDLMIFMRNILISI